MNKLKQLYILPFDHRSTFYRGLFGLEKPLSKTQSQKIKDTKWLLWQSFEQVYKKVSDKESYGILVDEEFGSDILKAAKKQKAIRIITVEKSGQPVFDFEYGARFGRHLLKFKPDYAKVLVRYNPANKKDNKIQLKRLKRINDFCEKNKIGLLFELLVPAIDVQLKKYKTQDRYDRQGRPGLTAMAIKEIRAAGVEPTIWKMEGMDEKSDWQKIIKNIKFKNQKDFSIVILGRGVSKKRVGQWFEIGAAFTEITGFAVGRTIFFKALEDYRDKKISKKQTIDKIAKNFQYFVKLWQKYKK